MPPRHGKSELASHWFPVWFLNLFPQYNIILTSYEADYAARWGRKVRNTIQEHRSSLRVRISEDSSASNRWETTAGGGMNTAGVGGPITGKGAHILIIDDPVKNREDAESRSMRERTWEWWQGTARERLEPMPQTPFGAVILIMTRWHQDDLAGRLLARRVDSKDEEKTHIPWHEFRLPALAEESDPLGRVVGAPLWPEKYCLEALCNIRDEIGPYNWASEYQQRPIPREGNLFWREMFRPAEIVG